MNILIFGGGGLAHALARSTLISAFHDVTILEHSDCDVRDYRAVVEQIEKERPDYIVCTAGVSDRRFGSTLQEVVETNLIGAMHVGQAAAAFGTPCVLVASTAGISPGEHKWYGPAKAGVINFARAMGNLGHQVYAVSPGRMNTRMRKDDFPDENPRTQLNPKRVASVIIDILDGEYAPGANVVVRKVGMTRVDVYEEAAPCLPSLL